MKGKLSLKIWLGYLRALGTHWVAAVVLLYCCSQTLRTLGDWVLADWTSSPSSSNGSDDDDDDDGTDDGAASTAGGWGGVPRVAGMDGHLVVYAALLLTASLLIFGRAAVLVVANVRACRRVHDGALWAVLRSPMSFFDTTPSGRVLNRFSSDQQRVDMQLRNQMSSLLNSVFQLVSGVAVVLAATPVVLVAFLPLAAAYYRIQRLFRTSAREIQRLQSAYSLL